MRLRDTDGFYTAERRAREGIPRGVEAPDPTKARLRIVGDTTLTMGLDLNSVRWGKARRFKPFPTISILRNRFKPFPVAQESPWCRLTNVLFDQQRTRSN